MTLNDFQCAAARTINPVFTTQDMIINGSMGLCGESGEVVDILKKYIYHKKPVSREDLVKELGDVLWYVAEIATAFDISLDDVGYENVAKLLKRFPNGFNIKDANEKKDSPLA